MTQLRYNSDGNLIIPEENIDAGFVSELIAKSKTFDSEGFDHKKYEEAIRLIDEFNKRFPIEILKDLTLEKYAFGFDNSFCYWLEDGTNIVAWMGHDGFNREYGVWFTKEKEQFYISSGVRSMPVEKSTAISRFEQIKRTILRIVNSAKIGRFSDIDDAEGIWHQAKTKMTYLYFPDMLIPVIAAEHVKYICNRTGLINFDDDCPIESNHKLLEKIRKIEEFSNWHPQKLSQFFYFIYPELRAK